MKNNQKKKIAILYSGGRYFGGIEQYLVNLFEHINKDEFDLVLLSLGDWPLTKRLQKQNHQVVLFSKKRVNLSAISEIGKYLEENKFDLLVSQGTVSNAYARAISLFFKIPNLVTIHSTREGDYKNKLIKLTYDLIEKVTRFSTSRYITVSKYLKNQLVKSGLPEKKIDVIYNGIDLVKPKARDHKRLILGSVGRLHPVKGYDSLIKAFAMLDNKRLRLKIAGSGDELESLKSLARELDVNNRIEFVGFQTDVHKFLDTIDVYVQPSKSEGFGLSVIEAMSHCLPVVVTPAGSLIEIVSNSKTGLVVSDFTPELLSKSIAKMVSNYELSKQMGENAQRFVEQNFDIEKWVRKTEKVYKEACL